MRILKWVGIALGGVVGLCLVVGLSLFLIGRSKAGSAPDVAVRAITLPTDSAALARGQHAAAVYGCTECHGPNLAGAPFPTPGFIVSMAAPNLTRGNGGVGATYSVTDWDRAIRHGIGKDGRRLIIMPSEAYNYLNDADAAALIAYLQTVAPVDSTYPARKVGPMGGILIATGAFPLAADLIAHDSVGTRPIVAPAVNPEYGAYLVSSAGCKVCHGPDLRGMAAPGGGLPAPSLVAFVANNSAEGFASTIRTGRTPAGRALDSLQMPWKAYRNMTDDELEAVRLYIQSRVSAATVQQ